jgi:16S rRNA (guanine(1405)-N(7))-methyltransferase
VDPEEALQALVAAVQMSGKYRAVCSDLIRNVGRRELAARRGLKEAIKATKNTLHQVSAAYMPTHVQYAQWERTLRLTGGDPAAVRAACRAIMAQHASSRERLPILESLYARTLSDIAPVRSVLDIACGFNPLAAPWMPLAQGARYHAYDIYTDLIGFIGRCLPLLGLDGEAEARDVTVGLPSMPVADVALLLKAIPCLEQLDRQCAGRLLDGAPAHYLLVSFPVRSLGGADRHMAEHYAAHLDELLQDRRWTRQRYVFESELVFLLEKPLAHEHQ